MKACPFFWLDVFAESPLAGNGLAVVLDADGVDEETMLAYTRETGLSEATFVQAPSSDAAGEGADYRNRIWTMAGEVPFAGHPSLGTAVAVAIERGVEENTFTQETGVGLQQVDVEKLVDGAWDASVHQEPAEFGEVYPRSRMARLLNLGESDLHPDFSPQLVSTGFPTLLVPLAGQEALSACVAEVAELATFGFEYAVNVYPFVFDVPSRTADARCFALDLGAFEDPATGSAAGPLVAYLQDILDVDRISIRQGVQMGRPSLIEARMDSGRPRVSGQVHLLMSGQVSLPD